MEIMSPDDFRQAIDNLRYGRKQSKSKYRNKKTPNADGTISDSRKEARIDAQMMLLKNSKNVASVKRKRKFPLVVRDKLICTYICDWEVIYCNGRQEVYDAKGFKTSVYRLKKKLMEALYGITIIEV
jgi:hypothetical protein